LAGEPAGTLVGGQERSVLRVYELVRSPHEVDTVRDGRQPEKLIHGARRILTYDSDYFQGDSLSFHVQWVDTADAGKMFVEENWGLNALVVDTSVTMAHIKFVAKAWLRYAADRLVPANIFTSGKIESRKVALRDAVDQVQFVEVGPGQAFATFAVEKDDKKWYDEKTREKATFNVDWTSGVIPNKGGGDPAPSLSKHNRLFGGEPSGPLTWSQFDKEIVGEYTVDELAAELKFCGQEELIKFRMDSDGMKRTETAVFDMQSNYEQAYEQVLCHLRPQCDCKTGAELAECLDEAEAITERYLAMYCTGANAGESFGLRSDYCSCQNDYDQDIKSGWWCYQWAFLTQYFVNQLDLRHFKVQWSSYVQGVKNGDEWDIRIEHSWISLHTCSDLEDEIVHLDPWATNSVAAYTTEEHESVPALGIYGRRNFRGETGLARGAVAGWYYPAVDDSVEIVEPNWWDEW
jgi:hypothetical protein